MRKISIGGRVKMIDEYIGYVDRVKSEYKELVNKCNKLDAILFKYDGNLLDFELQDVDLLRLQLYHMKSYANILHLRLRNNGINIQEEE